ncbi:MAG: hypothetical protein K2X43_03630 [Hyphomonadaceae bacterium]|jgi:hypothetical protein|nr:hypothetical protein [Hyphomonadaceae bacterium]
MSKPLVQQVAERARGLVADPRSWTQYAIARTGNNRHCEPTDAKAARFCAYGAILRAAYEIAGTGDQAQRLADQTAMLIMGRDSPYTAFEELIAINDGHRGSARAGVLALFEKALAKA